MSFKRSFTCSVCGQVITLATGCDPTVCRSTERQHVCQLYDMAGSMGCLIRVVSPVDITLQAFLCMDCAPPRGATLH
jgi:hypothetical protein